MTTDLEILASLTVIKSGTHTHYATAGYFLCPTHQNDRKVSLPAGTPVTCSKCLKRHAVLTERSKNDPK